MNNGILTFIVAFVFINVIVQPVIWDSPEQDITIETDCYDEYHNKINELTCTEKIEGIPLIVKIIHSSVLLIPLITAAIAFILNKTCEEGLQRSLRGDIIV